MQLEPINGKRLSAACGLMVLLLVLSGCVVAMGNKGETRGSGAATIGQELIDLKKARDMGVLTEAEYEEQKALLLKPPQTKD